MPPNTTVFLLGLAVGTSLLMFGLLLGFWFGKRTAPSPVDQTQFLSFVRNLSRWTSEFAGDVSQYQSQLDSLSRQAQSKTEAPREEVLGLLSQIMNANKQLQERLDDTEKRLETQTTQISSYLTEARTDGLTGLTNRRAFDKATDELFAVWTGKKQRFTMSLIDIDHFKQINDTYGHPAGDAVLKHVANTIKAEMREAVCVARYGGEEFGVLMLSSAEESSAAMEALREQISKMEILHDGKRISVTLSAGVAQVLPDEKIGKLVRRTDEALYAAKLGGRNRVYLHDGRNCVPVTLGTVVGNSLLVPANEADAKEIIALESRVQDRFARIVEDESRRLSKSQR